MKTLLQHCRIYDGSGEPAYSGDILIEGDRILDKVHNSGLHSLTSTEKRTLKRATQEELRRSQ